VIKYKLNYNFKSQIIITVTKKDIRATFSSQKKKKKKKKKKKFFCEVWAGVQVAQS
jgi:truncated hemoglobin YjbI